jgi:hypothetical protein
MDLKIKFQDSSKIINNNQSEAYKMILRSTAPAEE